MQVTNVGHGWIWPTEHEPSDDERAERARELRRRRDHYHYRPPLRLMAPLSPRSSASGWLITSLNQNPRSVTPEITVAVTDAIGHQYTHTIQPSSHKRADASSHVPY